MENGVRRNRAKNEMKIKGKEGRKRRGPRNRVKGGNKLVPPPEENLMLRGLLVASETLYSIPLIVLSHSHWSMRSNTRGRKLSNKDGNLHSPPLPCIKSWWLYIYIYIYDGINVYALGVYLQFFVLHHSQFAFLVHLKTLVAPHMWQQPADSIQSLPPALLAGRWDSQEDLEHSGNCWHWRSRSYKCSDRTVCVHVCIHVYVHVCIHVYVYGYMWERKLHTFYLPFYSIGVANLFDKLIYLFL